MSLSHMSRSMAEFFMFSFLSENHSANTVNNLNNLISELV